MPDDPAATLLKSLDNADTVARDHWGRYLLPHPITGKLQAWTRVSTIAKSISDQWALSQWTARNVAYGVAITPELQKQAALLHVEDDKDKLQQVVDDALKVAQSKDRADKGTDFHKECQKWEEAGRPVIDIASNDFRNYQKVMQSIRVDKLERIVVLPHLGVAGTLDNILYRDNWTVPRIGDIKTGKSKNLSYGFPEWAISLALYANATFMWAEDHYDPMIEVNTSVAEIIHVPLGERNAKIWTIDIEEGWEAVQLCLAVREWRKRGFSLATWSTYE